MLPVVRNSVKLHAVDCIPLTSGEWRVVDFEIVVQGVGGLDRVVEQVPPARGVEVGGRDFKATVAAAGRLRASTCACNAAFGCVLSDRIAASSTPPPNPRPPSPSFCTSKGMVTAAFVSILGFQNPSLIVTAEYPCGRIG
jgi:hypothetical protein